MHFSSANLSFLFSQPIIFARITYHFYTSILSNFGAIRPGVIVPLQTPKVPKVSLAGGGAQVTPSPPVF
jgi:hypothetical protein